MIEALKNYRPLAVVRTDSGRRGAGVHRRCHVATNVISDMTVATILDRLEPNHEAASTL